MCCRYATISGSSSKIKPSWRQFGASLTKRYRARPRSMSGPLRNDSDIMARRGAPWQEGRPGPEKKVLRAAKAGPKRHEARAEEGEEIDRKSTRLNSSHGYISYAVFCLEEKKMRHDE